MKLVLLSINHVSQQGCARHVIQVMIIEDAKTHFEMRMMLR